uniref:Uncharacterized protein n=1 Tax=Anopheles atroparvus TaxID=41427 RepID=A0A182INT0_ANOAO
MRFISVQLLLGLAMLATLAWHVEADPSHGNGPCPCPRIYRPVCGSDLKTYANQSNFISPTNGVVRKDDLRQRGRSRIGGPFSSMCAAELRWREPADACDFIEADADRSVPRQFCCESSDERRERDFALALLAMEALTLAPGWLRLVLTLLPCVAPPFGAPIGRRPAAAAIAPAPAALALVALPLLALLDRKTELRRRVAPPWPFGGGTSGPPKIIEPSTGPDEVTLGSGEVIGVMSPGSSKLLKRSCCPEPDALRMELGRGIGTGGSSTTGMAGAVGVGGVGAPSVSGVVGVSGCAKIRAGGGVFGRIAIGDRLHRQSSIFVVLFYGKTFVAGSSLASK